MAGPIHESAVGSRRVVVASPTSRAAVATAAEKVGPTDPGLEGWYRDYVSAHTDRLSVDLDLIRDLDPYSRSRILDVGSTPPILLAALKAEGREGDGVDIAPERFGTAMDNLALSIQQCDIEREPLPFDDSSFDVVLLNEVFEHLRIDPIHTIGEIQRVLRVGGALSLSTPNARSFEGIVNFLKRGRTGWCETDIYTQYEKLDRLGHMGHVREYTFPELQDFLQRLDLHVTTVVWRGGPPGRLRQLTDRVLPSLSPFMTLIARKRGENGRSTGALRAVPRGRSEGR